MLVTLNYVHRNIVKDGKQNERNLMLAANAAFGQELATLDPFTYDVRESDPQQKYRLVRRGRRR